MKDEHFGSAAQVSRRRDAGLALGAVREKPAADKTDDTPGVMASGEMSPRVLVVLLVLSFGLVFALIGGPLKAGLHRPAADTSGPVTTTPGTSSSQQPVNAAPPPPAAAPPPPPPAPVEAAPTPVPAYTPQSQPVDIAPVEAPPEPPPPAPAAPPPPPIPDILAPLIPFLIPPPPPPPPAP